MPLHEIKIKHTERKIKENNEPMPACYPAILKLFKQEIPLKDSIFDDF